MFTNKQLKAENAELKEKLAAFEGVDADALTAELNEAHAKIETLEDETASLKQSVESKDAEIAKLTEEKADFDKKVEDAAAAKVAEIGATAPVQATAEALTAEQHLKVYESMPAGAERAAYAKKHNL